MDGTLREQTQAPSSNELAGFHRINPATAAKGLNALVADGILYKRRGVGMFVATGARELVLERRRSDFTRRYLRPLLAMSCMSVVLPAPLRPSRPVMVNESVLQRLRRAVPLTRSNTRS